MPGGHEDKNLTLKGKCLLGALFVLGIEGKCQMDGVNIQTGQTRLPLGWAVSPGIWDYS